MSEQPEIYYDPYDFEIDSDPYPVWKRMRDEMPLYFNEKHGFYALSRWDDVERGMKDHAHLLSGRGTILELIKANIEMPKGMVIFEDPPTHETYRGLLSRVFTPRRMMALEPLVRKLCADCLDPFIGESEIDLVKDLAMQMPMRVIGMLLGIPEADQEALRDTQNDGLRLSSGEMPDDTVLRRSGGEFHENNFGEYVDWRAKNPSNDLMTDLLNVEFEDHTGVTRKLSREEVLGYVGLLAGAGNETTTKLISWSCKVLGDHADQRREVASNPALIPQAIEEILRFEPPSPVNCRYVGTDVEYCGQVIPQGSIVALLNASANRDDRKWGNGDVFDIHRKIDHHLSFGYGIHFCLGAALARLEGRVATDELLKRFPDYTIDLDRAVRAHTSTVRGWESLPASIG